MELKNKILILIVVLAIVLIGVGIYAFNTGHTDLGNITNVLNNTDKNTTNTTVANSTDTNNTNKTVGDNSPRNNTTANQTYKVYNPQSDSYVTVIGEKYDSDVNRWYTYDVDGVRYYNTRINH